jgi:hypothetical protein
MPGVAASPATVPLLLRHEERAVRGALACRAQGIVVRRVRELREHEWPAELEPGGEGGEALAVEA